MNRIKVAQILSIFNIMFLVLVFVFSYMGTFFIEDLDEYVAVTAVAGFLIVLLLITLVATTIILLTIKTEQPKTERKTDLSKTDRFCPDCGRAIPSDARICPYCKKDFEGGK